MKGEGETEGFGVGLTKIMEKRLKAGDFEAFGEGEQRLNVLTEIIEMARLQHKKEADKLLLVKMIKFIDWG